MEAGTSISKHGAYYGRWRGFDGRLVNKKIGKVRTRGAKDGITRADAERGLRRLIEAETRQPATAPSERSPTVNDVADELRGRLAVEGARPCYTALSQLSLWPPSLQPVVPAASADAPAP